MIEAVRESLVMILHTSEGARVTMSSLWHGTSKVRKSLNFSQNVSSKAITVARFLYFYRTAKLL